METMVVLGIVAMLFFAMVPGFFNALRVFELKAVARDIVSDLRLAQSRAISLKSTVTAEFNPKSLFGDSAFYKIGRQGKSPIKRVNLPSKFNFVEVRVIKFSSSGFPPAGGSGTVLLEDIGGRVKKVIVSSTGRVRME
jgi:type II secretory pathway pseudopilin PulG